MARTSLTSVLAIQRVIARSGGLLNQSTHPWNIKDGGAVVPSGMLEVQVHEEYDELLGWKNQNAPLFDADIPSDYRGLQEMAKRHSLLAVGDREALTNRIMLARRRLKSVRTVVHLRYQESRRGWHFWTKGPALKKLRGLFEAAGLAVAASTDNIVTTSTAPGSLVGPWQRPWVRCTYRPPLGGARLVGYIADFDMDSLCWLSATSVRHAPAPTKSQQRVLDRFMDWPCLVRVSQGGWASPPPTGRGKPTLSLTLRPIGSGRLCAMSCPSAPGSWRGAWLPSALRGVVGEDFVTCELLPNGNIANINGRMGHDGEDNFTRRCFPMILRDTSSPVYELRAEDAVFAAQYPAQGDNLFTRRKGEPLLAGALVASVYCRMVPLDQGRGPYGGGITTRVNLSRGIDPNRTTQVLHVASREGFHPNWACEVAKAWAFRGKVPNAPERGREAYLSDAPRVTSYGETS